MVFIDDKNKIKVGEQNYPISAVTRGRRVFVAHGQSLQSAGRDFRKISLTLTVVLLHDVPQSIDQSFYPCSGVDDVRILLKRIQQCTQIY